MNNKAAIIIPFRDSYHNNERYEELQKLSKRIGEICVKHCQPYEIFVIHRNDNLLFNRATLMNVGASIAMNSCDYFIFHDVDHLPLNNDNVYRQREVSGCLVRQQDEQILSDTDTFFGAVNYIKKEDYLTINGFCNYFWGWGWEDCAILARLNAANILTERGDVRFITHKHIADHRWNGNPNLVNNIIVYCVINMAINDGHSNLLYDVGGSHNISAHTTIYDIKIPPPQYDVAVNINKALLTKLVGTYDDTDIRRLVPIYSKDLVNAGIIDWDL